MVTKTLLEEASIAAAWCFEKYLRRIFALLKISDIFQIRERTIMNPTYRHQLYQLAGRGQSSLLSTPACFWSFEKDIRLFYS